MFLHYAVEELGVERIEARTAVNNRRAIGTLQRLGAHCERMIPVGMADHKTEKKTIGA
jgi:RimJ/RimL family protein N-acetyltransferase